MRAHPNVPHLAPIVCLCALLGCTVDTERTEDFDYAFEEADDDASVDPWLRQPDAVPVQPRLRMLLTDAPADLDSVFVTFDAVKVHYCDASEAEEPEADEGDCEDGSWLTVSEETITLDLLTLQGGVTAELGIADLPAGAYGEIRLLVSSASVVVEGVELPLTVPPGILKLDGGFALEPGMQTDITIDFDAGQSVHYAPGNGWMMQPVISIVGESTGAIPEDEEPEDEETEDEEPDNDGASG